MKFTELFRDFLRSERIAGIFLIICSLVSLIIANTAAGAGYIAFWHAEVLGKSLEFWVNDGLMTIFFLLIGLEIERQFYIGELSDIKRSMLPVFAAVGGMMIPAFLHALFNHGTATQKGFGIPMATDIAFTLAILSVLGSRVPLSLKVFITALAIIDDLGAIIVIALFYSKTFSLFYFGLAMAVFGLLLILNRLKVHNMFLYLLPGILLWYFMYRSGIHPTISGVLLAFALPFGKGDRQSPSYIIQEHLHVPVGFLIIPVFALVNTAIPFHFTDLEDLVSPNSLGILAGLVIGKPLGIIAFSWIGIATGLCTLPPALRKRHLLSAGMLAGIGFTMSIFITLLAFYKADLIASSKIAIMLGSLISGIGGYLGLKHWLPPHDQTDRRTG